MTVVSALATSGAVPSSSTCAVALTLLAACGGTHASVAPAPLVHEAATIDAAPIDAAAPGVTWTFDPIVDRMPDAAKFVVEDMRGLQRISLQANGYAEGFVSAIDVAYVVSVMDEPGQAHHVVWHVFADDGGWPAETPLSTFETTVVPDNHLAAHQPLHWTHHELADAAAVRDAAWLTWETTGSGSLVVAFSDEDLTNATEYFSDLACVEPGGHRFYCGNATALGGTPFVRVTFTGLR